MFEDIKHAYRISNVSKRRNALSVYENEKLREAKINKLSEDCVRDIYLDNSVEFQILDDERAFLQDRYLRAKADRYHIPLPDYDNQENYDRSIVTGKTLLSEVGIDRLRAKVREEKRQRRERIQSWLISISGLIGAITGLVGVTIGLVSVWGG